MPSVFEGIFNKIMIKFFIVVVHTLQQVQAL